MSEKEKVEGYVEHIIFRNEENGYTVLNLSMKGRELTCVGTLPMVGEGELIVCTFFVEQSFKRKTIQ